MNEYMFLGKYFIHGTILCKSGLHIGAVDQPYEIGGMENLVIRDPATDEPYIPGSSLKGKLRSLLEWSHASKHGPTGAVQTCVTWSAGKQQGLKAGPCTCGFCDICVVFGSSPERDSQGDAASDTPPKPASGDRNDSAPQPRDHVAGPTRLTVRDAFLAPKFKGKGDAIVEIKAENTIDRLTSEANPRSMERVAAGTAFEFELIFDIYNECDRAFLPLVLNGLRLLQDSTLGGGGTRGAGQVEIKISEICLKDTAWYFAQNQAPIKIFPASETEPQQEPTSSAPAKETTAPTYPLGTAVDLVTKYLASLKKP